MRSSAKLLALPCLILLIGCTEKLVTVTPPDAPVFLPENVTQAVSFAPGDTAGASVNHTVPYAFTWQTDRATTDEFYSGVFPDELHDSVVAVNVNAAAPYFHDVSSKRFPTGTKIYFRVRALGANGVSRFSAVGNFTTPN